MIKQKIAEMKLRFNEITDKQANENLTLFRAKIERFGELQGYKEAISDVKVLIEKKINNWYEKRRGEEQRALNEFVQRHVIDELIEEILEDLKFKWKQTKK